MKKILSTLAAVALSMVIVSNLDARRVVPRGGKRPVKAAAATPAKVLGVTKQLIDDKKAAVAAQPETPVTANPMVKDSAKQVVQALTDPKMTPEQQELVAKRIELANLNRDIELKRGEISDINYGWFGWGTNDDTKREYKKAKDELAELNGKKKTVDRRIRELNVITGKAWSNSIRLAIGALAAVGIVGVAYGVDQYQFGGQYSQAIGQRAMSTYESGKGYVSAVGERAAGMYRGAKARIFGSAAAAEANAAVAEADADTAEMMAATVEQGE